MIMTLKLHIRLRLLAVMFIAALTTSCGFTPLHGSMGHAPTGTAGSFGNVTIALGDKITVDDKEAAFWAQQRLTERLGTRTGKAHILEITPRLTRGGIGISGRDIATRYDLKLALGYVLSESSSGKVLDRGTINAVSTFTATNDPYALVAAQKASTKQLASDAADRLLIRVAGYYASKK